MDGTVITILANFGFGAVAAYALWTLVQKLIPQLVGQNDKLLEVISQNSAALVENAAASKAVAQGQQETAGRLGRMDDRLLVLEEQHKYGVRECPLLAKEQAGGKKNERQ